jgi:hypothetical protein
MRYRVSRIASLVPLLVSLSATGCGEVESGLCAGEQVDNVSCTVDICDGEAKTWAHIPNDDLCEAGQRCDPTAGCVAASAITGNARLLGKDDHSGITVTVNGVEGATTTTDAMGNWSLTVPAGSYTVTYSKDKYIPETSPELIALAQASDTAPDVELAHGEILGDERTISQNYGSTTNPDKSFVIEAVPSGFGSTYYATPADGSKPPTLLVANPNNITYTNTHAVWRQGNIIYSRPLTGATPPISLTSTLTGGTIEYVGTPGVYTVIRRVRNLPTYSESSLYIAKTDGSQLAGAAVWTQPDATHGFNTLVNNDSFALLALYNNSNASGPPGDAAANTPIVRIDLTAGTTATVNVGYAVNSANFGSISPDGSRVYGTMYQYTGSQSWTRGFIGNISAGTMTLAPNPGLGSSYYICHDCIYNFSGWLADNTFVFNTGTWYTGSSYLGGEGRVWLPNGSIGTLWPSDPNYYYCYGMYLLNGAVAWREGCSAKQLKVATVSATPTVYNLDTSGLASNVWIKTGTGTTGSYIAWTQVPGGSQLPNKVFGANIPVNLASGAPVAVQLGPNIAANCSFEGTLSGTTFFQLCGETGTLTAYPASTATASGTLTGVQGGLNALVAADRILFRKVDGNVYTAANTGALGADVKVVATKVDGNAPIANVGSWLLYRDSASYLTRVSKADGSVIDEPLFDCDMVGSGQLWLNTAGTNLISTASRCQTIDYGLTHTPTANLP